MTSESLRGLLEEGSAQKNRAIFAQNMTIAQGSPGVGGVLDRYPVIAKFAKTGR